MLSNSIDQVTSSTLAMLAHAGHGPTSSQGNSLWHYVSEPQHAWVFSAVILIAGALAFSGLLLRETSQD